MNDIGLNLPKVLTSLIIEAQLVITQQRFPSY